MKKIMVFLCLSLCMMFSCAANKVNLQTQVQGLLPLANAGLGPGTATGDIIYFSASSGQWMRLAGNTGSTNCLQETSAGVPSWGACTGGSGSGTVTSVGFSSNASWFTVTHSPITTADTITFNLTTGLTANRFVATPNGSTGPVGLRAIVAADIPALNYENPLTFSLPLSRSVNTISCPTCNTTSATVASVGLSLPAAFTVTNSPVTGSGTLTGAWNVAAGDYLLTSTGANTAAWEQINAGASCGDSTHGLSYSISTHTFGCQTITGVGTVTSVTGSSPISSSGSTTPVISIAQATTSTNGYLSSTDWNTFNGKQAAGSYALQATTITVTSPLTGGGTLAANRTIGCQTASASQAGCLAAADWTTFNSKGTVTSSGSPAANNIAMFSTTTNITPAAAANIVALFSGCSGSQYLGADGACHATSGAGTVTTVSTTSPLLGGPITTSGTLSIQQASASQAGYLSATDWTTFNAKGSGTVTSSGSPASGNLAAFTTTTNVAPATSTNIISLFTGCSGSQYLGADGACHPTPGGGTVTTINTTSPLLGGPITSSGTLSCQTASATLSGCLSSTDWTTFSLKQNAGSYALQSTTVTATSPLTGGGTLGSNLTIGIQAASGSQPGYLTSSDWTAFNGKGTVTSSGGAVLGNIAAFTSAGNISPASSANIIALFSGCSGSQYLGADGACHTAVGSGTVTTSGSPVATNIPVFTSSTAIGPAAYTDITNLWSSCSGSQLLGYDGLCHTAAGTGTVTQIVASSPLTGGTITTSGTIGCQTASSSQAGCLSSTDWSTFNGKGSGTVTHTAGSLTSGLPVIGNGTADVAVGTKTGSTTEFPTWSGVTTAARCVHTDASGNLIVASADCNIATGTVTSVTFTGDGTVLSSTPSGAVTTSGTVTASLNSQAAHTWFGNATASTAVPSMNATALPVAMGGTGQSSFSAGLLRSSGSALSSSELSGDVTTSGTNAATVVKVNGLPVPASASFVGTNSSSQFVAVTGTVTKTIASGTATLGTATITSGACATVVTATATGVVSTDVLSSSFNGDPTGVTGYVPSTSGTLTIFSYPSANLVSFKVCNMTSASVTPGAITLNWHVVR